MRPGPGEPAAGPWQAERFDVFVQSLMSPPARIVAVDGRGAAGKSTFAERLRAALGDATVVHTDDVAWWHSRFGWAEPMIDGILTPYRQGRDVRFQPPGWAPRGRTGHLEVPASTRTVIIEGVGASRRELVPFLDVSIWIQSDYAQAEERGLRRDMDRNGFDLAEAQRQWQEWEAEEVPFLEADRPWERADVIVAGTPALDHDPATHLVTAGR
ncbi:uridine kinase family protein [Actinoplanes couchii]|uniref:Uridine kinase n=1 Tax=Actinoplanes couchii TaxID=403638 RepID=A0ABQ3XLF1_9ACTN|nr:hypothetical protein [Actinoplanes couchii]MDR6318302.1 hypothetical protein [Actinoplanes couchii]GID59329.1 hypothetical protein Aco03nite_077330 [Actinoplanes couchii]